MNQNHQQSTNRFNFDVYHYHNQHSNNISNKESHNSMAYSREHNQQQQQQQSNNHWPPTGSTAKCAYSADKYYAQHTIAANYACQSSFNSSSMMVMDFCNEQQNIPPNQPQTAPTIDNSNTFAYRHPSGSNDVHQIADSYYHLATNNGEQDHGGFYEPSRNRLLMQPMSVSYSSNTTTLPQNVVNASQRPEVVDNNKQNSNNHDYHHYSLGNNSFNTNRLQENHVNIDQSDPYFFCHPSYHHQHQTEFRNNDENHSTATNYLMDPDHHHHNHLNQVQQNHFIDRTSRFSAADNNAESTHGLAAAFSLGNNAQCTDYNSSSLSRFTYMNHFCTNTNLPTNNATTTQSNDRAMNGHEHNHQNIIVRHQSTATNITTTTSSESSAPNNQQQHYSNQNYNNDHGQFCNANEKLSPLDQQSNEIFFQQNPPDHRSNALVEQQEQQQLTSTPATTRLFYTWSTSSEPECQMVVVGPEGSLSNDSNDAKEKQTTKNNASSHRSRQQSAFSGITTKQKLYKVHNNNSNSENHQEQVNVDSGGGCQRSDVKRPTATRIALISATKQQQQNTNAKTNQCQVCGRNYARPSTLKTHLRTHTNERPFKCNVCFKTFSQAANLTAHQRVHTGERPFSCPICSRQFSQSSSVITHLRTHSGERPYRCNKCSRTFSDSSTLTKHCRIHSGEKPYQCHYCPLNFSQSGNLSRHLKLHLMGNLQASISSNLSFSRSSSSSSSPSTTSSTSSSSSKSAKM